MVKIIFKFIEDKTSGFLGNKLEEEAESINSETIVNGENSINSEINRNTEKNTTATTNNNIALTQLENNQLDKYQCDSKNMNKIIKNQYNEDYISQKKLVKKRLKYLYKKIDAISSLLWSHDNHITGKRLRSENDQEDNKLHWKNRETTQTGYGEIALGSMTSLFNLFQNISKLIEYNANQSKQFKNDLLYRPEEYNMTPHSSFLDIGSGFGKPVFHSALQVGCFSRGIEVVPARVEFCLDFYFEFLEKKKFFDEIEKEHFSKEIEESNEITNEEGKDKGKNISNNNIQKRGNNNIKEGNVKNKSSTESDFDREIEMNIIEDLVDNELEVENEKSLEKNKVDLANSNNNNMTNSDKPKYGSIDSNAVSVVSNSSKASREIRNNNDERGLIKKESMKDTKEDLNYILEETNKIDSTTYISNCKDNHNNSSNNDNKNAPERYIMFHELKKISGDSYLNCLDFNTDLSQRNLRNKKTIRKGNEEETKATSNNNKNKISTSIISNNSIIETDIMKSKKEKLKYPTARQATIDIKFKNVIKFNDLNSRYYNEILKERVPSYYLELKINPQIKSENCFIESLINKKNFIIHDNKFLRNKIKNCNGVLSPEFNSENVVRFGEHFVLNELNVEITAIYNHLYSNVSKLINNCLYADSLENYIAKSLNLYYENLKFNFIELTSKIENSYILDIIYLTNMYFWVGKKFLNNEKLYDILNNSYLYSKPDILEFNSEYLILNKSNFPFMQTQDFNSLNKKYTFDKDNLFDENTNSQNGDFPSTHHPLKINSKKNLNSDAGQNKKYYDLKYSNKNNNDIKKIKDLYKELDKHLNNNKFILANNENKNHQIDENGITNANVNSEKNNLFECEENSLNIMNDTTGHKNLTSKEICERIAEIPEGNMVNDVLEKNSNNISSNESKLLKEILVDFKFNYFGDWSEKLNFLQKDATKYKSFMNEDKKEHFSHIYAYNKLMSKECRCKIAKVLNKTKFKVLAWYSNPLQTKKAGLKNFTFLSKFPMQSTSTEKFHVYVYIKTK